ncbi:methyltransferase [Microvirga zambiensis]|uniref:methyltransferase n=1 Tax=Microvirga zambiensis TaxID=1402137 RepID=UPI00191F2021|nr:methyltransferase [Microvirga zambiensis]
MRVNTDVLAALDAAEINGDALRLVGKLDRKLYETTNKVIEAAGGKWNRKAQAHLFDGSAADAIEQIILTGEVTLVKQQFGQFDTPPSLAASVIERARIEHGMSVLEPSAGIGNLARAASSAGGVVGCYEIDPKRIASLRADEDKFSVIQQADFLTVEPQVIYDRVVMNPPFAKQDDIRHVLHAYKFLRPGGLLVAIMAAGIQFRTNQLTKTFLEHLQANGGTIEDLPPDAFRAAGANVRTVLVTIEATQ